MADENKAFALQGIVRNATKIGVQDGQSEDLVNLRYKDGAWRAAGAGELEFTLPSGSPKYEEIFIHTNVYRHVLGVVYNSATDKNGTLYWFANIDADGVFSSITPLELTSVYGDLTITQTGHLITIIDEKDKFEFFVFKTSTDKYVKGEVDENGERTDRSIYPFGQVHFNWHTSIDKDHVYGYYMYDGGTPVGGTRSYLTVALDELVKKNKFTKPILAVAAIELYDGSFVYASNPILINPGSYGKSNEYAIMDYVIPKFKKNEDVANTLEFDGTENTYKISSKQDILNHVSSAQMQSEASISDVAFKGDVNIHYDGTTFDVNTQDDNCVLNKKSMHFVNMVGHAITPYYNYASQLNLHNIGYAQGYDISLSLDDIGIIKNNSDVFSSLCIFVTQGIDAYDIKGENVNDVIPYDGINRVMYTAGRNVNGSSVGYTINFARKREKWRTEDEVNYNIAHSNFYLLKRINISEIDTLQSNPIIDLSKKEDEGLVKALESGALSTILTSESLSRCSYLPKYSYLYNGRLHIANYKSMQFHGYPIDQFHKNNHSVKLSVGTTYPYLGLQNLVSDDDDKYQIARSKLEFIQGQEEPERYISTIKSVGGSFAYVVTEIDTDNGTQRVVREVAVYDPSNGNEGYYQNNNSYFEDLDPFICFPDYRAKRMTIMVATYENGTNGAAYSKTFNLTPHHYLNIAYYINEDLTPIKIKDWNKTEFDIDDIEIGEVIELVAPSEKNVTEYYPNGLKVSSTDNPMNFPVENTYQVGSAEIVAMCSNAVAVGTGQTGSAPLYVFCKDGVYALFVDSSGNMAYTNARVIARDVCNNARSVTPIDDGVMFSTDRGLMLIAGEQVQEIGQPLEGDWCKFTTSSNTYEYDTVLCRAYGVAVGSESVVNKLADLGSTTMVNENFLSYLKGAVINYNHNERELMVTNPSKSYSFIMDRNGQWSRVNYSADEYVNNYPTSYRVKDKKFYQVDKQSDVDNKVFVLSKALKLDSIGFKELHRFVVRGYFETLASKYLGLYVYGSYDGRRWSLLGVQEKTGKFTDIGCLVERTDCKFFRYALAGQITKDSRLDYIELSSKQSRLSTKIR